MEAARSASPSGWSPPSLPPGAAARVAWSIVRSSKWPRAWRHRALGASVPECSTRRARARSTTCLSTTSTPARDGQYVSVGALEPQFYALLVDKLGLADVDPKAQYDRAAWPALKARLRALFLSQPSAHWRALLEGCDACFAPVLSLAEAATHPHMKARGVDKSGADGASEAAVAPRFLPLE